MLCIIETLCHTIEMKKVSLDLQIAIENTLCEFQVSYADRDTPQNA